MLGTLRVVEDDHPVDLGGPRQRRLLAALVLSDGAPVSVDRLVECVFGDEASPSAADTLRSYVTRLRRSLSSAGHDVVVRDGHGYRLVTDVFSLDTQRFADGVSAAQRALDRGDHAEAAGLLRDALSAWRGTAYDDLADETWVAPEARRLDESHRVAQELLAEALTSSGRAPDAVDVLREVLADDPYREGAVGRLMLALYRAGRPADALAAYREFAARAVDDLGIDPGPELQRLHEQVLTRDPLLDVAASAPTARGYEVGERLGRGRQGTVYAARMPGVNRDYAIRVYDAEVADAPSMVATFDADVRLLVAMDEETLLPVYDGWREPGAAVLVMRRMSGTLADTLALGPLAPTEAREVVQRVGRALVALARRGRRHGRVEPSSVMIDEAGHAYLAEPLLGPPSTNDEDAEGFLRLARGCLPDQPPGWWDGLDSRDLDTVAMVTQVLARLDAPTLTPENPYVGLRAFEAADADRYFGREHVVANLVERVTSDAVVLLVGGSGSGKSSIVRAGLVPSLHRLDPPWTTTVMVPGSHPMQHLAEALHRVQTADSRTAAGPDDRRRTTGTVDSAGISLVAAAHAAAGRLLLVVDQMEELFTVADPAERESFLAVLTQCANGLAGDVHVVATVRADYFDHPLDHPVFGGIAAQAALPIPPMSAADLERSVLGPASGRLVVEDGLASELVTAVVGEPGALPALQFTVRELAERGGRVLRRDDLDALGGVDGAIAHRAEQMYAGLEPDGQQVLKQVLQRMVVVDEIGDPSRRTVPRADLARLGPGADELVEQWVQGRFLVTGRRPDTREPTVTLAHEAVLTRWPRLREWVDEDRERLLAMARLTQAAQEWADLGHDPAALVRGGRLEQAEQLTRVGGAPAVVQAFVRAAQAQRTDEQRQVAEAAAAEQRTSRRLRRQRWMLAVALVAAIVVGWVALEQRGAAVAAAERQRLQAQAGASSLVAASNEAGLSDWSRALLLAVEAHRVSPSPDTERNLLATLVMPGPVPTTVWTSPDSLRAVVVDPDSSWAVVQGAGGSLDVVDLDEGRRVRGAQTRGPAGVDLRSGTLVFGELTADGSRVRVLDDTGDRVVATLADGAHVTDIEVSPAGDVVAVADSSGRVRLLGMGTWRQTATLLGVPDTAIQQVAWSESGQSVHAFDEAGAYLAWDVPVGTGAVESVATTTRRSATARDALQSTENSVDVSVDLGVVDLQAVPSQNRLSVVSTREGAFWVDMETAETEYLLGPSFGPGSPLGGTATGDGGLVVVDGSTMDVQRPIGASGDLLGVSVDWNAVDADVRVDDSVVTVGSDGQVTTWRLPARRDLPGLDRVPALDDASAVVVAPDGRWVLMWDGSTARVLDGRTFAPTGTVDVGGPGTALLGAAFVAGSDHIVAHTCPEPPEQPWGSCSAVLTSFSIGDGAVVAGPVDAGSARLWEHTGIVAGESTVASVDSSSTVTVRDSQTLVPTRRLRFPDSPDDPGGASLSRSSDGSVLTLTTRGPESFAVWETANGSTPELQRHDTALGAGDPRFDASNLSFETFTTFYGAAPLPNRRYMVGQRDAVRVFTVAHEQPLDEFENPWAEGYMSSEVVRRGAVANRADGVMTAPMSTTDGMLLLTGVPESYWLWDPTRPQVIAGPIVVDRAVLDPTGDRLFVWRGEEAFVLSLHPDDMVATACEAAGRGLTEQEWSRSIGAGEPFDPVCGGGASDGS